LCGKQVRHFRSASFGFSARFFARFHIPSRAAPGSGAAFSYTYNFTSARWNAAVAPIIRPSHECAEAIGRGRTTLRYEGQGGELSDGGEDMATQAWTMPPGLHTR